MVVEQLMIHYLETLEQKTLLKYIPSIGNHANIITFLKVVLATQDSNLKIHININTTMFQEHVYARFTQCRPAC